MNQQFALIGHPLGHSLSAVMHQAAFKNLGLDCSYRLIPVTAPALADTIEDLRQEPWGGFNITLPYKSAILPLLDQMDPLAAAIGAVNTVVNDQGILKGFNTDAAAFLETLEKQGFQTPGKNVLILGAGGAARAVVHALAESVAQIHLLARSREKAAALCASLPAHAGAAIQHHPWHPRSFTNVGRQCQLIVNCTPLGMHPNLSEQPWPEQLPLPAHAFIYDLIYNPRTTRWLRKAGRAGLPHCDGLDMLVEQGALAFELWTGYSPDRDCMRAAANKRLEESHA